MFKKLIISLSFIFSLCATPVFAASNLTGAEVGDFGTWTTPHNQQLFINGLTYDIDAFQHQFQDNMQVQDYVPIEAKLGRAFIGAMSMVAEILDRSLVRFVVVFMIILFAFWTMLEAYQMLRATQKARELVEDIIKKAVIITVWIFILNQGAAQIFMWIMGPIISLGTYLSDLILNSITATAGASLPDTCAAIHKYVAATHTNTSVIDQASVANLLCVPTRLSGFFYTAVAAGWQWMLAGIGQSAFTFVAGLTFVVIFIYNIYKFALMALGVIADLFITVLMLPFTALHQTFGGKSSGGVMDAPLNAFGSGSTGKTTYDGIAGQIFNGFLDLFKTQSLSDQIMKFINAAIYFVSLSIVIALCAAILSGIVDANLAGSVPGLENDGFMTVLIVGCLVAYLANKAGDIAKNLGGSIDDSLGKQFGDDIKKVWDNTTKFATSTWKAFRGTK